MKQILIFLLLLVFLPLSAQQIASNLIVEYDVMDFSNPGSFRSPWRYSRSDSTLYRWDYVDSQWEAFGGSSSVAEIGFDSNREILRMWEVGDNIGGSTVGDFLEYLYFAPPTISSSIIGGTVFEVGTSNALTFRSGLDNPAATDLTNYIITETTKGTVATFADGSQLTRTDDFGFTYTPMQSPVGGVGVWDAQSYTLRSSADYSKGAESGSVQSPQRTIRGVYPVLYGMVADTATAFADPYGELTKLVQAEGDKTVSYTGTGLIFYGFPQTWSDTNLSSIIDPNGFNVTASFTRVTYPVVTSTGLTNNYTAVPYVFYFLNTGSTTTSASNYTFNQ